ncbi:hypothetical protein [Aneurinibacillus sp. REN35]|uniref:hypothetical protein n=1 Tax=Aneurinibacillus sp. REN35 TaxID=3237286 RepID=UPI003527C1DB
MIQGFMTGQIFQQLNTMQRSLVELVPGQVFQGKVLKLFPDNLATVQLGGLTVTARLETPLELGQKTWLQVQPGGQPVTLKVISQPGKPNQASEDSMEGLAKALGASVTKESLSLLQKAVEAGIPLRADSVRSFQQVSSEIGNEPEVEQAILLAAKKGLPLTKETVLSLRAFAGNANLEGEMGKLLRLIQQALEKPGMLPNDMKESLQGLITKAEGVRDALAQAKQMLVPIQPNLQGSALTQTESPSIPASSSQHNGQLSSLSANIGQPNAGVGEEMHQAAASNGSVQGIKQALTELFEKLGLSHEKSIAQLSSDQPAVETAKSSLLQLLQHAKADLLPAQLREHMQQIVHQLTGQQLMMSGDTGSGAFVQVALQLPMPGQEDGENALIQIESRKQGDGEVDPENCRLFFYLSMQHMGETMLDVAIVNRILSVTLYNEKEGVEELVRALRPSLEENLAEQGYRLSGLRVLDVTENRKETAAKPMSSLQPPSSSLVHYKGVDFRV